MISKMVNIDVSDLAEDIQLWNETFAKTYCKEASVEFSMIAKVGIKRFYLDYDPIYYDRTFDLRDNSIEPYYHNNGKFVYGGVRISSNKMQPYHLVQDPYPVAYGAWRGGYHGVPWLEIKTSPTPYSWVEKYASKQSRLNKIYKIGVSAANKIKYKVLTIKE